VRPQERRQWSGHAADAAADVQDAVTGPKPSQVPEMSQELVAHGLEIAVAHENQSPRGDQGIPTLPGNEGDEVTRCMAEKYPCAVNEFRRQHATQKTHETTTFFPHFRPKMHLLRTIMKARTNTITITDPRDATNREARPKSERFGLTAL